MRQPSDYLVVQLVDEQGERLAIVKSYTEKDAGSGWRRESLDLSRFAGKTVYLSFLMETVSLFTSAFYLDGVALEDNEE